MSDLTTVRERFGELAEEISAGAATSLRDLQVLVGGAAAEGRAEDVAWLRLGLAQLASYDLRPDVSRELLALDSVLEGTQTQLDASRARRMREESRRTLKERILEVLQGRNALRPKDLVEIAQSDAYQVSRALRELREGGMLELAPPPDGSGTTDGRAVWYRLSSSNANEPDSQDSAPGEAKVFELKTVRAGDDAVQVRAILNGVDTWASEEATVVEATSAVSRLSSAWLPLVLEEGLPGGTAPANLDAVEGSSRTWTEFASTHDLARLLEVDRPPIWLSREGNHFWILTRSSASQAPVSDVLAQLSDLGDTLVDGVEASISVLDADVRSIWASRHDQSVESQIATATRIGPERLREISVGQDADVFWEYDDPANQSELLAAARMSSEQPTDVVRSLVETIRGAERVATDQLDSLGEIAWADLQSRSQLRPFEQGYALALWLRDQIGSVPSDPVDPEAILREWEVPVVEITSDRSIDAVACWGPRHGPMIAVNRDGVHSNSDVGRRATLAHEIAHLLVDRAGALPLAEVLGGQVAPLAEKRANAFAAELLLPREVAGAVMVESDHPKKGVRYLGDTYGASREIIAWQAYRSEFHLSSDVLRHLGAFVRGGRGF